MMDTTTVRINRQTYNEIRKLAEKQHKNMQNIIDLAIQHYLKIQYFQEMNLSYTRLRENQEAWEEEQNEREDWETTLQDDLDK
ncbi:MAG: toxin-antitoxin system protein [Caldisericia bacterium]|nr:toxin-antitoxin system protein [Caldisericia bacterium]